MKISPVPAPTVNTQDSQPLSVRSIRMNTNATPGYSTPPESQELSIPDNSEASTNTTVEATQPISPQYAALAKQRRALQVKERALLDRERALESKSQGSDQIPIDRLKSEPLSVLLEAGVTYEQLTEAILNNQGNPELSALKAEMKALKEGVQKQFSEQEENQIKSSLATMRRQAESLISSDDYELVRESRSLPDVMRLIERTYRETQEVLEVPEALKLVEDRLVDKYQKLANLKKIQGLHPQVSPMPQAQPQRGMRTLTNKDTASTPMNAKQRALQAFWGTLKK